MKTDRSNLYVVCRRNGLYRGVVKDFFASQYWRRIIDQTAGQRLETPVCGYNLPSYAFAVPWREFGRIVRPVTRLKIFRDVNDQPAFLVDNVKRTFNDLRFSGFEITLLLG